MPGKELFDYTIDSLSEGEIRASLRFNKMHPVYAGHFPGTPVTPGVCQLMAVKAVVSDALGHALQLSLAPEIKFLSMHNPFESESLTLAIKYGIGEDQVISVNALISDKQRKILKLNGEYRAV